MQSVHRDFFFKIIAGCDNKIDKARVVGLTVSTSLYLMVPTVYILVQSVRKAFHFKLTKKG
jgi:hypothetical protein